MRTPSLGNICARNATAVIALAAVLGGASSAGCGFVFSQPPPAGYESRLYFDCGESYAPPVIDSIAIGLAGLTAVSAANDTKVTASEQRTNAALAAGYAVLSTASAIYGYRAAASCRAARQQRQADWIRAQAQLWSATSPSR